MAAEGVILESSEISSLNQLISRHVNCLADPNRATRKRGLEGLKKELFGKHIDSNILEQLFKSLLPQLTKLLADPIEKCRELTIAMIEAYINQCKDIDLLLPVLVPVLVQRLGQQDIIEQSEELRLQLVQLIAALIAQAGKKNAVYLDEYIMILQKTIVDPYPEVKKESCQCASALAKSTPENFHQQSESLIKPLLNSISHQHSRVRVAVVHAIGDVLVYGNNKNVDDVVSHLAQRLFDHAPPVREAVTRVAGMWLLELPDRYSFWHKLMPLLLTSLTDELPSIQEEAASLWHDVGIRYLRENEQDMKDKEDFEEPKSQHYPPNVERPNLGCRELMNRNQSKILPGLVRDLLDWVADTRKKSAALLYTLMINSESNVTQHTQLILDAVYKAAIDDEQVVVDYVEKSVVLLGYFVRPDVWVPIVLPTVTKHQHYGSILALANLIKGSELSKVEEFLPQICEVMSSPDICSSGQLNVQNKLIEYVNAVLSLYAIGVLEPISISYDLYKTLITVISVAAEEGVVMKANTSLQELSTVQGLAPLDMFRNHTMQLLDSFGDSYMHWTNHSTERHIFDTAIIYCGSVVGDLLDRIMPVLTSNMNPEKDPEVRLKLFSLISRLLQNSSQTLNSSNKFGDFAVQLITNIILPNCVWKAGRTASAIRTTAVSCLWCLLKNQLISTNKLMAVVESTLTQLLSLIEDDSLDTRLISCRVIMHTFNIVGNAIDQHRLYNLYPQLLKRLDDSNDNVRIAMTKTLISYLHCFNGHYDAKSYRPHYEELVRGLLIHLDDPNSEVQEAVQEVLEKAGQIQPKFLAQEIEAVQHKHRTSKYCTTLLNHCEKLIANQSLEDGDNEEASS